MIKGINLHYLGFDDVKRLVTPNCGNSGFNYYTIKADRVMASAYRSYSWKGVYLQSVKSIDCDLLKQMMARVRTFDPTQIHAIRGEIDRQLSQSFPQPPAAPSPVA